MYTVMTPFTMISPLIFMLIFHQIYYQVLYKTNRITTRMHNIWLTEYHHSNITFQITTNSKNMIVHFASESERSEINEP